MISSKAIIDGEIKPKPKSDSPYTQKKHIIEEYDVWVGPDNHILPEDIEEKMYELGFSQRSGLFTREISPVENIKREQYRQWFGIFEHEQYEVSLSLLRKGEWKMLIFKPKDNVGIDDGTAYTWETGYPRLKQLLDN